MVLLFRRAPSQEKIRPAFSGQLASMASSSLEGLKKIINWPNILCLLLVGLGARATILGEPVIYGFVLWAVLARIFPGKRLISAGALLLGSQTLAAGHPCWFLAGAVALFILFESFFGRGGKSLSLSLLLPLILLPLYFLPLLWDYYSIYELGVIGINLLLAIFLPPLLAPLGQQAKKPELWRRPTAEIMTSLCLLAAFSLTALAGSQFVGAVSLARLLAKLAVLSGAYLFGAAWGATAGVLAGLFLSLSDPASLFIGVSLSFAGVIAGMLRSYGKLAVAAGFLLAIRFLNMYSLEAGFPSFPLLEDFLVTGVMLALPQSLWLPLKKWWEQFWPFEEREEELRHFVAYRIKEFANIFRELAATFHLQEESLQGHSERQLSFLMEMISRRVCTACEHYRRCWEKELYTNYHRFAEMLRIAEKVQAQGKIFQEKEIPNRLRRHCPRSRELARTIDSMQEIYRLNYYWQRKVAEGRELVSRQLEGISLVMNDLANEIKLEETARPFSEHKLPLRFSVEVGVAQVARDGQELSGDSYALLQLKGGKQVFILSDGMGNGARAHLESRATVSLIEHLLEIGFRREVVLRIVNSLLQLRTADETFATVDLVFLDLTSGEAELLKVGAVASYIKSGDEVREVGSATLPLGILQEIRADLLREKLEDGDLLVMVTDGMVELSPETGENWLLGA
ncbi:MAG: SpoIIE family protein phosphatase, partial [Firmicutes bacterium]|nr:SpoIIE family protein phosphatase [Bacillota bacterium]